MGYEQYHRKWLEPILGIEEDTFPTQDIGDINCKEGRLLTFPNVFQHQVQPFELEDESKPGHRKILAFFLVDPHVRVLSTANVPVQREDWQQRLMSGCDPLVRLPNELRLMVAEILGDDFPISMEKAKMIRERLMEERKVYRLENTKLWEVDVVSLCEH